MKYMKISIITVLLLSLFSISVLADEGTEIIGEGTIIGDPVVTTEVTENKIPGTPPQAIEESEDPTIHGEHESEEQRTEANTTGNALNVGDGEAESEFGLDKPTNNGTPGRTNTGTETTTKTPIEIWIEEREKENDEAFEKYLGYLESYKDLGGTGVLPRAITITREGEEDEEVGIAIEYTGASDLTRKRVEIYYYDWVIKNRSTGLEDTDRTDTKYLTYTFTVAGTYKVTSIPYCEWDYGHYDYYTVENDDGTTTEKKKWVHEYYEDGYDENAKKTYNFTMSIFDLGKPVDFPIAKEKEIEAVYELVK